SNADKLEHYDNLDIDNLVTLVEESLAAYRVCQSRIEAVEQALQSAFEQAEVATQDKSSE
ncbi:exodeoxyribonuclease VII, partial [Moraxella catarrhalis]